MNKNDTINLVFSVNRRYLGSFVCSMKSIVLHGGYSRYQIYILHSTLDESMGEALCRDFGDAAVFHFIPVCGELLDRFPGSGQCPQETYFRFLAPFLLPRELDRALYLDADTIVINSLREFYNTPFDGNAVVGCAGPREFLSRLNQARQQSGKPMLRLDPGVLLMDLSCLRSSYTIEDVFDCARRRRSPIIPPDQYVLTALCGNRVKPADATRFNLSERSLKSYNLEHRRNPLAMQWLRENSVILHYSGIPRPESPECTGILRTFYDELMEACRRGADKNMEITSNFPSLA